MSALAIAQLIMGNISFVGLIVLPAYLATAFSLNNKGGKITRYIGYFTSSTLSLSLLGAIYVLLLPLLGVSFEPILLFVLVTIGSIGVLSFKLIKDQSKSKIIEVS
ncbi:hypothetical protein [Veronia nyctiphanis]|uniref:hypothetical protein n=1 Tax=Veronia nyctiphanis TaxID=1278244 RepID=UPI00100A3FA8|nr:hypothetical protein [Veronia nyctiphanis]